MLMSLNIRRSLQKLFNRCPLTAYLFIPVIRAKDVLDGKPMHRSMEKNLRLFCSPEQLKDRAYLRRTKRDMWYSFLRYYCGFDEYFQLQFPKRSHAGRREFVTDFERIAVCTPLVDPEMMALFKNKWNTYEALKDFYHRDAVKVCPGSSPEDFFRFADAHPLFIAKPLEESCGIGVHLVEITPETDRDELFCQLQQENVILEEKIVQCETLNRLHPASVNTIRCATFLKDGEVHILFTFLRIGQKNSVVDNGGAGGLIACIDTETGIVNSPGVTEFGQAAILHPDTNAQILGLSIPRWEEMKETATKLALTIPSQKYISWDLSLTEKGWVVVEGNCLGQFIGPQISAQCGIRQKLSPFFNLP